MDAKFFVEEYLKDVGLGNTVFLLPPYYPHIHRKLTCSNVTGIQNETRAFHEEAFSLLKEKFPIEVETSSRLTDIRFLKTIMFNPNKAFIPNNAINYYPTANTPNLVFLPHILEEDGSLKFIAFDSLKEYSLAFSDINPAIEYVKTMVKDTLNRVAITLLDLNEFTEKVDLNGHHIKVIGDGRFSIAGYAIDNKKVLEYYVKSRDGLFSFFPFIERELQLNEGEVLPLNEHPMFSVYIIYTAKDSEFRFSLESIPEAKSSGVIDCHSVYEEPGEDGGKYLYYFCTKQLQNVPNLLLPGHVIREMINVIAGDIKEKDKRYSLPELVDRNRRTLFGIIEDFRSNNEIVRFGYNDILTEEDIARNQALYGRINQQFIVKEIGDFLYRERLPYQVFHEKQLFIIHTDKDLPDGSRYFGTMGNPGIREPLRKLTKEEKEALKQEIKEKGLSVSYMQNKDYSRTGVLLANPSRDRYLGSEAPFGVGAYSVYHYFFVGKPDIGTVLDTMRRYHNLFRDRGGISRFSVDKETPLVTYKKPSKVDVDEFFIKEDIYVTKAGDYFIKHTEYVDNKVINVVS